MHPNLSRRSFSRATSLRESVISAASLVSACRIDVSEILRIDKRVIIQSRFIAQCSFDVLNIGENISGVVPRRRLLLQGVLVNGQWVRTFLQNFQNSLTHRRRKSCGTVRFYRRFHLFFFSLTNRIGVLSQI